MELGLVIITSLSLLFLFWIIWQFIQAKKFTQFKNFVNSELKEKVIVAIKNDLIEHRNDDYPNNQAHIDATIYYWTQYPIRILQAALKYEVIDEKWLIESKNIRNSQHLSYIQRQFKD